MSDEPRGGFALEDAAGVRLVRCGPLAAVPGIAHAFSTRIAGSDRGFDLGGAGDASPTVAARRRAFLAAAGVAAPRPALLRQIHGASLVASSARGGHGVPLEADGIVADVEATGEEAAAVRVADCVPILLADRGGRAVAAVHAGWRGTSQGIAIAAVERLGSAGIAAGSLTVALGPSIRGCCYEVGDEVVRALAERCGPAPGYARTTPSGRPTVDLHAANAAQLVAAGVPRAAIHSAPWCTRCRNDLFFSVRAEGVAAGRSMAVVGAAARRP